MGAANWSFNMYPGLSIGCINTLLQFEGRLPVRQWVLPVKKRLRFLQQRAFIHRFGSSLNGHVHFSYDVT